MTCLRIAFAAALGFLALQAGAQTTPGAKPSFEDALVATRAPLALVDGRFSGPGAAVLETAIEQSRFVLLGEDHLTREIPPITAAICDVMHPDAYAVEAGPYAARYVNSLLRDPRRLAEMAQRNRAHPNTMAFLDIREENDLAAHCAAASANPQFALWGLDQEFLGATPALLEAMSATRPGPQSRAAIAAAEAKNSAAEAQTRNTGDFGKLFLLGASDGDIAALETAVNADGTPATRDVLHEFTVSRRIYRLNAEGSPDSNLVRAELLKQHFLSDYLPFKARTPAPRILLKLGDNHTGKGFNYTHELNLGNFIAELAAGEQAQSLHLLVLGAKGEHFTMQGYGKPLGTQSFVMTDDPTISGSPLRSGICIRRPAPAPP